MFRSTKPNQINLWFNLLNLPNVQRVLQSQDEAAKGWSALWCFFVFFAFVFYFLFCDWQFKLPWYTTVHNNVNENINKYDIIDIMIIFYVCINGLIIYKWFKDIKSFNIDEFIVFLIFMTGHDHHCISFCCRIYVFFHRMFMLAIVYRFLSCKQ